MSENVGGIGYTKPTVKLLNDSGIGVAEVAARTCYDSFANSNSEYIQDFGENSINYNDEQFLDLMENINNLEESELLSQLAWTYFHHSILEHATVSFLISGTSRGVLQEHARHRIQSLSVRSTRYTMSSILNAFNASILNTYNARYRFIELMESFNLFVTSDKEYNAIEIGGMFDKLSYQRNKLGVQAFTEMSIAKSSIPMIGANKSPIDIFNNLEAGKKKRNVGDNFKHIITDNVKVDMVVTFNIRSLKNFYELRDSGAAWFQIQWLAQAMKSVTPDKYLDLIIKPKVVKA